MDTIIKKLIELFNQYDDSNKIDIEFLLNIALQESIKEYGLEDYIKGTITYSNVINDNYRTTGNYVNNNIILYHSGIKGSIKYIMRNDSLFTDYELGLIRPLMYLKAMFLEIEHAKQKKIIDDTSDNSAMGILLKSVYQYGTLFINNCVNYRYLELYELLEEANPQNRISEIKSNEIIISLLECLGNNAESLKNFFTKELIMKKCLAYLDEMGLTCPTEVFFKLLMNLNESSKDKIQEKYELLLKKELSDDEKMLFGLYVSKKQIQQLLSQHNQIVASLSKRRMM